jgi:hypothetical protein
MSLSHSSRITLIHSIRKMHYQCEGSSQVRDRRLMAWKLIVPNAMMIARIRLPKISTS